MKIAEAKEIYSSQLDVLLGKKRELSKILEKESESEVSQPKYDRLELTKELSKVEKQYEKTQSFMEELSQRESILYNTEVAKQQGEAMGKAMEDMIKCLEIARRISKGAKVPAEDERKLMELSMELYLAAKNMAMMNSQKEKREYDSLVEDEEGTEDSRTADEIAGDAEVTIEMPEVISEEISFES